MEYDVEALMLVQSFDYSEFLRKMREERMCDKRLVKVSRKSIKFQLIFD